MSEHNRFMGQALALARLGVGYTSPNPMVGAVVVNSGRIVGEGYHQQAGGPHAEVRALANAGQEARGGTLYVTLEPCNHHGRTPPCTQAIIATGIKHVVYAVPDPNPHASGGAERLQAAGIRVSGGFGHEEAQELNRFFFHHVQTVRPYVLAKFASSLDGKIATNQMHSRWITGSAARQRGHELRQAVDAILVGAGTVTADNPRLTTRLPLDNPQHPLRVVLDSTGRVPLESQIFNPELPGQTLVATTLAMSTRLERQLQRQGVEVWRLPMTHDRQVNIELLLKKLGHCGVQSLLVEGGGTVLGRMRDLDLINEVWAFIAPVLIGGAQAPSPIGGAGAAHMDHAWRLQDIRYEQLEQDMLIRGRVDVAVQERRDELCLPVS